MPNCDWGRPCDCTECRTIHEHVVCPNCGFTNIVAILREVEGYEVLEIVPIAVLFRANGR